MGKRVGITLLSILSKHNIIKHTLKILQKIGTCLLLHYFKLYIRNCTEIQYNFFIFITYAEIFATKTAPSLNCSVVAVKFIYLYFV